MSKAENYVIGMDCGTTNIKAIILGDDGVKVAEASKPSKFLIPEPQMHEQDANEWWLNIREIFNSLHEQAGDDVVSRIRGIAISSHTVTMLPIDKDGTPLRNALTYQDSRSYAELEEILETMGRERYTAIVGGQPAVAFLPSKILWFKRHEPELFEKTYKFIQASSYINYKLTGKMTTDIDQATRTQCLDMTTLDWSKEIGDVIGVDLDQMMPELKLSDEVIGFVTQKASKETGIPVGIPVFAGCSDALASMYATGMSKVGDAGESSGTTSLVFVGSEQRSPLDIPVITRPCTLTDLHWVFDAPLQTTGAAIKWFIENFANEEIEAAEAKGMNIYDYLNEYALESKPGASGLFFFPYLNGERAPLWNDYASGMFIGMRTDMRRSDLVRAIFEGTSYALRHVIETVKESGGKVESLRICGGGAKSRTWAMIKASMLHVPVLLLNNESGDVPVGDAIIAGNALGIFENLEQTIQEAVKVQEVIYPIPEWEEAYDKLYPYYIKLYKDLDADLKSLKSTVNEIKEKY